MQGHLLHQQQQFHHHLASLLSAASAENSGGGSSSEADRLAALDSLRRAVLYPPNAHLVAHSAPFLSQGLHQLLSDQSHPVRLSASIAYGSLCSILCSASLNSNSRQNTTITAGVVDCFIGWALPMVSDVCIGDNLAEVALEGLREFLTDADAASLYRYAQPVLKSCQELLEDERTPLNLLHLLLSLLSLISVKFWHCFQPHFIDIVDLLLGWALMPDFLESDRFVIMDTFLQFKNHWTSNLHVSIKLLLKILGDMEVLIQDKCIDSDKEFGRLVSLFSCFATILQASTADLLETDLLKQISEPLESMVPQLLACLSLIGQKSGWEKWANESWKCLILLGKVFQEKCSTFYTMVVDILFQNLRLLPTSQVPAVLKANLQLLSLQKFGLHQDSVKKLLLFDSPLSLLRLHPNYILVENLAETYLFICQHDSDAVTSQAISSIMEELQVLGNSLKVYRKIADPGEIEVINSFKRCSLSELIFLINFDLELLLCCLSTSSSGARMDLDITNRYERALLLMSFISEKLNPFLIPVQDFLEVQVHVVRIMRKLSESELSCKLAFCGNYEGTFVSHPTNFQRSHGAVVLQSTIIYECLDKYSDFLIRCLNSTCPVAIKLEGLEWINSYCRSLEKVNMNLKMVSFICESRQRISISKRLLTAVLDVALDREVKVRCRVALLLEKLLHGDLVHPDSFHLVAEVTLDRLGDPDASVKHSSVRVLTNVLPAAFLAHGIFADQYTFCNPWSTGLNKNLNWKQALALKKFPMQLQSQHLVTILSYISQRWKVPLSSWIYRLVLGCTATQDSLVAWQEEEGNLDLKAPKLLERTDATLLEKVCPVNNLAAVWWSIHEAARYSVSLRLRTNLGGPTQTFAALERMLLDVSHVLLIDSENSDGNLSIGNSRIHLLPMRLLLDFVESLKKHVYNAYEGSVILPHPTRQSLLFFLANRKVCEEWFSRILEPMLNASLAMQCHHAIFCYSLLRLQHLQVLMSSMKEKTRGTSASENSQSSKLKIASDVMNVLRYAALALCRMHESEVLDGLHNWAVQTFSPLFNEENKINSSQDEALGCFSWIVGLRYQAQGQYEKAAAYFSHLLQTEEVLSFMGSDGIQFVIERIIESYTAISDWKLLETWLAELQALRSKHAGRAYCGALTAAGTELNSIHALACFDEGNSRAAWAYLDLTPKSSSELTLYPKLALERSEEMLLRAMLLKDENPDKAMEKIEKAELMLDEVLSVVQLEGLGVIAPYITQLHCLFVFVEGLRHDNREQLLQFCPTSSSMFNVLDLPFNKVHQDCGLWLKIYRVYRTVLPSSPVTLLLCQKLATLARKQSNLRLAERLSQYLKDSISKVSQGDFTELFSANLQFENALLDYAGGNYEDAVTNIWSVVHKCITSLETLSSESYKVMYAKSCLKLSTWLKEMKSSDYVINKIYADMVQPNEQGASLIRNMCISHENEMISIPNRIIFVEELAGVSVKLACRLCPTMGKAWLSYASWCYSQAKSSFSLDGTFIRSCSISTLLVNEFPPDRFRFNEEELSRVKGIITDLFIHESYLAVENLGGVDGVELLPQKDSNAINSLIQQAICLMESSVGAPGVEDGIGDCAASLLSSQLCSLFLEANPKRRIEEILGFVDLLVNIWWQLRRRRVSLFGHAAHAYLQYLSCPSKLKAFPSVQPSHDFSTEKVGSCSLRATLYVLNILLNYGVELKEVIEPSLASVPMLPWQEITPQLFARLVSHPQKEVRRLLEGLLMMLAKFSPWSIVYPTLVDVNNTEVNSSEELQRILDCLGKLYPQLVKDAQLMINELGNITVLWEEQWLSMLQDLHSDVLRRINMLKEESRRIAENATLAQSEKNKINASKYTAVMAPIVVALERRLQSTSREPQTPHEEWFQKEYGEQLKSAITNFKISPLSSPALGDVWRPFEVIATSLLNYQRKSLVTMSEVAPPLAMLSASEVPMPGLEKQISLSNLTGNSGPILGLVTVSSFSEKVTILATKTKPKKIVIQGSDGHNYVYLLKGREDLRLDARIMQLLQAVNSFLYSGSNTRGRLLAIRYYSVTPISGRAGLIQWVDNVTSIYTIFKSWQERVQLARSGGSSDKMVHTVPCPNDMFYGKIIPALKEKGIKRVISRKDWPHEVKRKVLIDLMREVPKELLRKEIWCASEGFAAYSVKSKRFSSSIATMSMVGHVLGLGDRHLDNILMDFSSGEIIHIDYNVCFDKGRRLKIPEIVPFRLTQTIETALGLTGTEGIFKDNCKAVLSVLQRNKDVLLMMLDVFVWDPLIEWTRGDADDEAAIGGEEKKGMELAVSLSLFASRFHEIRVPLQEHHDLLCSTLPAAESFLEKFLNVLNQYEIISAIFYHVEQERSTLLQLETSAKSVVAEASSISEKAWASYEIHSHEFTQAKITATEKAQEAAKWMDQHGRVLDALRNGSFPIIQAYIKLSGADEALSLVSAVTAAGVPLTVVPEPTQVQCFDLDREISRIVLDLDNGLSLAVEALQQYSLSLQRVLPLNYITSSPVNGWSQILKLSINNISSEGFALARRQAAEIITNARGDVNDSVQKRHQQLLFDMENYVTCIDRVKDECMELANSIGPDTEAKSKDRLLSAFTNFMQSTGLSRKDDGAWQATYDSKKYTKVQVDLHEKMQEVLVIIHKAAAALFQVIKSKVLDIFSNMWNFFHEFKEQMDKCAHIIRSVNELLRLVGFTLGECVGMKDVGYSSIQTISIFQDCLHSSDSLIKQMTESVLPEVIKLAILYNTEVMEAFGSISQIRGSTDTALEQLIEVELEKKSLADLEENYVGKVETVMKQQLALEEAAKEGREHLSWEEAEELATQEDACRAQLDHLKQSWNRRDVLRSSLEKREASIRLSLVASERQFSGHINIEPGSTSHAKRSKILLNMLAKPFNELELIEQLLPPYTSDLTPTLADFRSSGSPPESVWKFAKLLKNHSFFLWKVSVIDSVLDSCIRDISSFVDHSLGFEQLYNILKKKLEIQLHEYILQYWKDRVASAFVMFLENEHLKQVHDEVGKGSGATAEVQRMLIEYCNTLETASAARSAIWLLQRQKSELTEALHKTIIEIVQIEWLYSHAIPHPSMKRVIPHDIFGDDILYSIILGLDRMKLLENLQTSVSTIAKSVEYLQLSERTSVSAEAQLERAMGWACAGSSSSGSNMTKSSGIPSEFHDHILKRRQLLHGIQDKASSIMNVCASVLEFELSRDGLFQVLGEVLSGHPGGDGRLWQQVYMNALTRCDAAYHSFKISEQEWRLAQKNMEVAASNLFSATSDLSVASIKAKSVAGDFQDLLTSMKCCAYEVNDALSNFGHVSRGQTTLTSECGIMLEEVLAMGEGLHDIHKLAKEAAVVHGSLMADLNKVASILLPIETSLATDLAALGDTVTVETDNKISVIAVHGQVLYKSYSSRVGEACLSLRSLVPTVTSSVRELHTMLIKLARTASLHAKNLHKAIEGLGDSQSLGMHDLALSSDILDSLTIHGDNLGDEISSAQDDDLQEAVELNKSLHEGWISPPDTIYSSSLESISTSTEAGLFGNSDNSDTYSDTVTSRDSAESSGTFHLNNDGGGIRLGSGNINSSSLSSSDVAEHMKAISIHDGASMTTFGIDVLFDINKDLKPSDSKDEKLPYREKGQDSHQEGSLNFVKGKNAYALSVLRRVEKKLDGRDIEENRSLSISEKVEYLINQATSLDNLCNMYEGWTPWI